MPHNIYIYIYIYIKSRAQARELLKTVFGNMASHHALASAVPNPMGAGGRGEPTNETEIIPPWRKDKKNSRVEGVKAARSRQIRQPDQA